MSTVKNPETQVRRPDESLFKRLTRQQLFIPVAALVLLVLTGPQLPGMGKSKEPNALVKLLQSCRKIHPAAYIALSAVVGILFHFAGV